MTKKYVGKVLNLIGYQGNTNLSHSELPPPHPPEWLQFFCTVCLLVFRQSFTTVALADLELTLLTKLALNP